MISDKFILETEAQNKRDKVMEHTQKIAETYERMKVADFMLLGKNTVGMRRDIFEEAKSTLEAYLKEVIK